MPSDVLLAKLQVLSICILSARKPASPPARPVTERAIRTSFVNRSRGEAERLDPPEALTDHPREDLDVLGWRDPGALYSPIYHISHITSQIGQCRRWAININ
ncbi:FBP domain-containing protein [Streptosporangium roseum]|uniref:FBP domain-containing protein n=1 Tax=Streptosporangium roseum TaxID=2001 RepID=UPI00247A5662|nr:FBP domain-containing protein [Streptosporangium roseum]